MSSDRIRAYCCRCRHVQLFKRVKPMHRWHLLFTIFTLGVWLVSWISAIIFTRLQPWRCPRCDWNLPRAVALGARSRNSGPPKISAPNRTTAP